MAKTEIFIKRNFTELSTILRQHWLASFIRASLNPHLSPLCPFPPQVSGLGTEWDLCSEATDINRRIQVRLSQVSLRQHLKQSSFHHFHPSSSLHIHFSSVWPSCDHRAGWAVLHPPPMYLSRQKAAVRLFREKLQCSTSLHLQLPQKEWYPFWEMHYFWKTRPAALRCLGTLL